MYTSSPRTYSLTNLATGYVAANVKAIKATANVSASLAYEYFKANKKAIQITFLAGKQMAKAARYSAKVAGYSASLLWASSSNYAYY